MNYKIVVAAVTVLAMVVAAWPGHSPGPALAQAPGDCGESTTSLDSHWDLDEASGPRINSIIGGSALIPGPSDPPNAPGHIVNAVDLERGNSEYLQASGGDPLDLSGTSFTLVGWINPESISTNRIITSKYDYGDNLRSYEITYTASDQIRLYVSSDGTTGGRVAIDGSTVLSTGQWYHVAAVFDSAAQEGRVYVNGVLDGSASTGFSSVLSNPSVDFLLGAEFNSGTVVNHYDGLLDEWRVYRRALSGPEISTLHTCNPATPTPTPTNTPTNTPTATTTATATATPVATGVAHHIDAGYNIVGEMRMFWGSTAPDCWIFAQGQQLDLDEYALLAEALDYTAFGDVVNVPDMRGRVPVGADAADTDFWPVSFQGGEKTHTLTVDEMPSHTHPYARPQTGNYFTGVVFSSNPGVGNRLVMGSGGTEEGPLLPFLLDVGGDQPHNNLQPYMAINYIIYTGVCQNPTPTPVAGGPLTGVITGSVTITEALTNAYTYTLDTGNDFHLIRRATYGDVIAGAGGVVLLMVIGFISITKFTIGQRS